MNVFLSARISFIYTVFKNLSLDIYVTRNWYVQLKNEDKIPDVAAVLETAGQMTAAPEQGGPV